MTIDPDTEARVRASFAAQSLMTTLGARLERVGAGETRIVAPIQDGNLQQHGAAHAGVTFAIGDSAAGYAALTLMPADVEVMTVEMKINLLRPATGDLLIAEGKVIKPGQRLTVVQANVFAQSGSARKHVALLQGTMIPVAG